MTTANSTKNSQSKNMLRRAFYRKEPYLFSPAMLLSNTHRGYTSPPSPPFLYLSPTEAEPQMKYGDSNPCWSSVGQWLWHIDGALVSSPILGCLYDSQDIFFFYFTISLMFLLPCIHEFDLIPISLKHNTFLWEKKIDNWPDNIHISLGVHIGVI